MIELLSKIYHFIKLYKRFHIFSPKGIYVEIIVGNKIYVNWRNFGKRKISDYKFHLNKYKNIILINKETSEQIESNIFLTQQFDHYTYLLERENFLRYFLKKNIQYNITPQIFA